MVEIRNIKMSLLELNEGQMYGLPKNPRWIRDARYEALKRSIEDAPEMLDLREILVYPLSDLEGHEDKFIIIGGNMRYRACLELGYQEVPCKVIPLETPVKKLREYVIKDNEAFGQNDWDVIANEWDVEELNEWGVETDYIAPPSDSEPDELEEDVEQEPTDLDAEEEEKPFVLKITFPDADKMTQFVMAYKDILENDYECTMSESGGAL